MTNKTYRNELPPQFENWTAFYREVLRSKVPLNDPGQKFLSYNHHEMSSSQVIFFDIGIDFLKARVFDEIEVHLSIDRSFMKHCKEKLLQDYGFNAHFELVTENFDKVLSLPIISKKVSV